MALVFGVTGTGGYGVLNSLTETSTADIAEARNELGKVTNQQAYSMTKEATAEGVFNSESHSNPGTSLTVGAVTGLITNLQKTQANTDYQKVSVTVQKKDAATQVAYST